MQHTSKFNRHLLSGTILVLSVVMTGCGLDSGHVMGDLMGDSRTVPDEGKVNFSNRHTPILNPGNTASVTVVDSAGDNASPSSMAYSAPMPGSYPTVTAGRRMPVENESILAGNTPPTMSAPTAPVMAAPMPAPVPVAAATVQPMQPQPAMNSAQAVPPPVLATSSMPNSYPTLASVPAAPPVPEMGQANAQMNAMVSDQNQLEAARHQLMTDPNATVMTSSQTGQLVDNPAMASAPMQQLPADNAALPPPLMAPQPSAEVASASAVPAPQPKSEGWLSRIFGGDDDSAQNATVAPAQTPEVVAGNASMIADMPSGTEIAPNVILGEAPPFPGTEATAPADAVQPVSGVAIAATPPAQPMTQAAPVQPELAMATPPSGVVTLDTSAQPAPAPTDVVHLTPPPPTSSSVSTLPDVSQVSASGDEPVTLVPPSHPSRRVLPASRYASRDDKSD